MPDALDDPDALAHAKAAHAAPPHPLAPLSASEVRASREALRVAGHLTDTMRFSSVALAEPPKAQVLAWTRDPSSARPARRAASVLWDRADGRAYEAVVELAAHEGGAGSVASFTHVPGVTPNFTVDEWHEAETALKASPEVVAALARRGVTDLDLVLLDTWTYGRAVMPEQWRDRRLGWADVWVRSAPGASPYAGPVAGLKFVLDMNTFELLAVEEPADPVPAAPVMGEYDPEHVPAGLLTHRPPLAPLHVTQPEGPSFTVVDGLVRWQGWSLRVGFTDREGLVLHQVTYDDAGRTRQVAHRMSFAEMVVPYRDASPDHYRRTAYDIGEWGLGYMTTSLELGCDCLGEIRYLDVVLADSRGEPYDVPQAVCLHEEDEGVLWKHVDANGRAQVRRRRRMVVQFSATVANYEYLVSWRFGQDGSIECEVRATGIMVTTPFADGTPAPGTVVDRRTYAPLHQHFLVARLDLDIDGQDCTVLELDDVAPGITADDPGGLRVLTRATPVTSEAHAGRDVNWATQRAWKVVSASATNAYGDPTGYVLVAPDTVPHLFDADAAQFRRAPVIGHDLWVTRHHDDERWPAGQHPTQSESDDTPGNRGMSAWVADDEPLVGTDVVLWHVFGIHHRTRPEDWPVMPVDLVHFMLKPSGFFDRNPALDVAAPAGGAHGCAGTVVPEPAHP